MNQRPGNRYEFTPMDGPEFQADKKSKVKIHSVPLYAAYLFVLGFVGLFFLSQYLDRRVPTQLKIDQEVSYVFKTA